jgi:hypothetical protein
MPELTPGDIIMRPTERLDLGWQLENYIVDLHGHLVLATPEAINAVMAGLAEHDGLTE